MPNNRSPNPYLQINVAHIALLLLPMTAALGVYLLPIPLGFVNVYFFRLLVLILLVMSFILKSELKMTSLTQIYIFLMAVWLIWAGISSLWTPDISSGLKDFVALALGLTSTLLVITFVNGPNRLRYLRAGWILAFVITGGVAFWEILTGEHLVSSFSKNAPSYMLDRKFVSSTSGNPNNYGAFLLLCFPFIVWEFSVCKNKLVKGLMIVFLIIYPFLLTLTGSRLSLLGGLIETMLIIFFMIKGGKRIVLLSLIAGTAALVTMSGIMEDLLIIDKFATVASQSGANHGSILIRINTTLDGLWMLSETYGLGVGVGGFEHVMSQEFLPYPTYGIINPHNFSIEVLAEYGIVIFSIFVLLLAMLSYKALGKVRSANQHDFYIGISCLMGLSGYIFASAANSSYLEQPVNWIFLGSMVGVLSANKRFNKCLKAKSAT